MKCKVPPVFMMVGDEQFSLSTRTDNLPRPAIETPLGVVPPKG
ncbi:MAG TPA: hypothetical protein VF772_11415 [Terriglobales bacterium]